MDSVWEKLNKSLNDSERFHFNKWRDGLYLLGDKMRNVSRNQNLSGDDRVAAMALVAEICKIPRIEEFAPNEKLLPLRRMAARCGVASKWLKEKSLAGEIPSIKAGERLLFHESEVIAAMAKMGRGPSND